MKKGKPNRRNKSPSKSKSSANKSQTKKPRSNSIQTSNALAGSNFQTKKNTDLLEYLLVHFVEPGGYWESSKELAAILGLNYKDFLFKSKSVNGESSETSKTIWATVVVMTYCMSSMVDYHEHWHSMAEKSRAWVFAQPIFLECRKEYVLTACKLLNADESEMNSTIFAHEDINSAGDKNVNSSEANEDLGDWQRLYLEEPPYTMYYWNCITNETTWDNPLQTKEKSRKDQCNNDSTLKTKEIVPALKIDRTYIRILSQTCIKCKDNIASVLCTACCEGSYYCDKCCDAEHSSLKKMSHAPKHYKFVESYGKFRFPEYTILNACEK